MKIFSVVGVRRSGKTTTVTELIRELKRRGYTVGTVKTIFCPVFSMDEEGSNTYRHKMAGADVVVARGNGETDIIHPKTMEVNEIAASLSTDYLIVEGDYELCVPQIVCAHNEQEVIERRNERTFLVSGQIADEKDSVCGIAAVSAVSQIAHLADVIEQEVPDAVFPLTKEASPLADTGICRCGCHKGNDAPVIDDTKKRKHIFLTGEKQVGKSTLLMYLKSQIHVSYAGFETHPYETDGVRRGFVMHSLKPSDYYFNDIPISVRIAQSASVPVVETFEKFGAHILREAKKTDGIVMMDELGKFEEEAHLFQREVHACLNEARLVLGVLQKTNREFVRSVAKRNDVLVYEVTKENREALKEELLLMIKKQMER
jgi:molybdopterin-guanine dinucleotide biosynthesis protein MobB